MALRKTTALKEPSQYSFNELQEICQKLKKGIRSPGLEVKYTSYLLDNYASRLGNDVWSIKEQRCLAFIDSHNFEGAQRHISEFGTTFGASSKRVRRLKAMLLEAQGEFGAAEEIYQNMLEENPGNMLVHKRLISIAKAKGNIVQTIELLVKYLEDFESDTAAWKELADMYLSVQKFDEALYCTAELLLATPTESHLLVRYAEIFYTKGDLVSARRYYAHALELQPKNNMRALWGIILTSKAGNGSKDNAILDKWAEEQITKEYSANSDPESLAQFMAKAALTNGE